MALTTKLLMRQGQSLVMTPQLLQAIKLLQFSNIELASFVQDELERNPLLERADEAGPTQEPALAGDSDIRAEPDASGGETFNDHVEADWSSGKLRDGPVRPRSQSRHGAQQQFRQRPRPGRPRSSTIRSPRRGLSTNSWSGSASPGHDGEPSNLESNIAARLTLKEHLAEQLPLAVLSPRDRLIGHAIIDAIDDSGYVAESLSDIADRLGAPVRRVTDILMAIQTFDPVGVGARNLAECLTLQLRDRNRFDPAMEALVGHLDMVARRDLAGLRKVCGVDDDDIADMIAEIKRLDPKPGRAYGSSAIQPVVPDVNVRLAPDGSWMIELNTDVLPRLLVNPDLCRAHLAQQGQRGRPQLRLRLPADRQLAAQEPGAAGPDDP